MMDYQTLIEDCDSDIKSGSFLNARRRLAGLNVSKTPRMWRLPLAKICRRCGALNLGLKLLYKIILSENEGYNLNVTPEESAEYAILLQRSGALSEAMERLRNVDPKVAPEALLNRAFIHFAWWEFEEAIPLLKNYLKNDLPAHSRQVGLTNLAFALTEIHDWEAALEILEGADKIKSVNLRSTWHGLRGQIYLDQENFAKARAELEAAHTLVQSDKTNDRFFIRKLTLILNGVEAGDPEPFRELRELALKCRAWNAVRESDFYSLKVNFDHELMTHLYFGSPLPRFRELIKSEFGVLPMPHEFIYGQGSSPCMDLKTGRIDGKPGLNPGRNCHRLVELLLQDFYQPLRVPGLFSKLFPGEHYSVSESAHRVRQLISRTRSCFHDLGIPVALSEAGGFYSLTLSGNFSFRVPLDRHSVSLPDLHFEKLRVEFANATTFSAKDVVARLNVSMPTVNRILNRGLETGQLECLGREQRNLLYRIKMPHLESSKISRM